MHDELVRLQSEVFVLWVALVIVITVVGYSVESHINRVIKELEQFNRNDKHNRAPVKSDKICIQGNCQSPRKGGTAFCLYHYRQVTEMINNE